ncbi:hypothetical protein D3C77_624930 [compost metagenome]
MTSFCSTGATSNALPLLFTVMDFLPIVITAVTPLLTELPFPVAGDVILILSMEMLPANALSS